MLSHFLFSWNSFFFKKKTSFGMDIISTLQMRILRYNYPIQGASLIAQLVKNPPVRLGRSAGEGIGYPLQYSWAQLVKNPSAMQETWVIPGLGRSPGEGKGYPLQYSGLVNSINSP